MAQSIDIPSGSTVVSVKMMVPVNFGPAIIQRFMAPPVPGLDTFNASPSLSFLIEHPSGRKLVFDLGIRKDHQNYSASIAAYLPTTNYNIQIDKDVSEILSEGGIALTDIEAVIWSHWHWDHIGDPSTFPSSTQLVVGRGFKESLLPGFPTNPDSPIRESDYFGRTLREISFNGDGSLTIGRFPAYDYFGDGSFYLLDSPGHAVGHMCGLARVTTGPDTFVLTGGDVCHYSGIMRPSKYLPVPNSISPHPCFPDQDGRVFCPGRAWEELQLSRSRKVDDTLYDLTFGLDTKLATETVGQLQELDCDDNILVIIAHDAFARDILPHYPADISSWKVQGWGERLKWAFLKDLSEYWQSQGVI